MPEWKLVDLVHQVPLDAPVVLCEQYGTNVCYHLMKTAARLSVYSHVMSTLNLGVCIRNGYTET